jgi:CHAD domain-containing protein
MEIEAKYVVPDRDCLSRLKSVDTLAGFDLGPGVEQQVVDRFCDSHDRLLLAAGWFLRFRQDSKGLQVTLKSLARAAKGLHRREEWNLVLGEDLPPSSWPAGPLREQVAQIVGEAELEPLVQLQQTRVRRSVTREGRAAGELCLDEVHFRTGALRSTCLELEVELDPDGTEKDLETITSCLREEWALEPQTQSKFERALALLDKRAGALLLRPQERTMLEQVATRRGNYGKRARALLALDDGASQREASSRTPLARSRVRFWARRFGEVRLGVFPVHVLETAGDRAESQCVDARPPDAEPTSAVTPALLPQAPDLLPDDSMAEAARKTFRFHLLRMLSHEAGTREGTDPESLHDMRVATRRMRAAARVFDGYLDQEETKPFYKALRRTGRVLGTVRDLDVFRLKLQAYLDGLPPDRAHELDPLLAAWQSRRDEARGELLQYLTGDRYRRFTEGFARYLELPAQPDQPAGGTAFDSVPHRLRHTVPMVVEQRLSSVLAHAEAVSGREVALTRFHQLRIAGKELRYALEFFEEVLGPQTRDLVNTMKRVQDHLGDLQDAVVACNVLRDFLTWGTWEPPQKSRRPETTIIAPGVATYLAVRQVEVSELVSSAPPLIAVLQSLEFRLLANSAVTYLWQPGGLPLRPAG